MNEQDIAPKKRYEVVNEFSAKGAPFARTAGAGEQVEVLRIDDGWIDFSVFIEKEGYIVKGPEYSVMEAVFRKSTRLLAPHKRIVKN